METSWTIVTVIGKGNCERMVFPRTPLLELTMYQQMQMKMILINSLTSERVTSIARGSWYYRGLRDSHTGVQQGYNKELHAAR